MDQSSVPKAANLDVSNLDVLTETVTYTGARRRRVALRTLNPSRFLTEAKREIPHFSETG
jgi:hypothetical protein